MSRLLLSIIFVVLGSAQVLQTAPTICSSDRAFFTRNVALWPNEPPIFRMVPEAPAANARGTFIVVLMIPTEATRSDVLEALTQVFADRKAKSQTWQIPAIHNVLLVKHALLTQSSPVGSGADYSDSRGTVSVPIPITDVTGLEGALSSINTSITNLAATVANLNATVNTLSSTVQSLPPVPVFVDSEVPVGTIDGSNTTFTISTAPSPQVSINLVKNGMRLTQGSDYSVSGSTIVFSTRAIPQPGDTLLLAFRH